MVDEIPEALDVDVADVAAVGRIYCLTACCSNSDVSRNSAVYHRQCHDDAASVENATSYPWHVQCLHWTRAFFGGFVVFGDELVGSPLFLQYCCLCMCRGECQLS
jgi:hypothetical protein